MLTDPIADMLTRIRNAHLALHKEVNVPRSKMKEAMATISSRKAMWRMSALKIAPSPLS